MIAKIKSNRGGQDSFYVVNQPWGMSEKNIITPRSIESNVATLGFKPIVVSIWWGGNHLRNTFDENPSRQRDQVIPGQHVHMKKQIPSWLEIGEKSIDIKWFGVLYWHLLLKHSVDWDNGWEHYPMILKVMAGKKLFTIDQYAASLPLSDPLGSSF